MPTQQEIEIILGRHGEQIKTLFERTDLYNTIDKALTEVAIELRHTNEKVETTNKSVDALKTKIECLDSRPKTMWHNIVDKIIGGIITALVSAFMAYIIVNAG